MGATKCAYDDRVSDEATVRQARPALTVQRPTVRVLSGPNAGKILDAEAERITVGTAEGNDLILTDRTVSRFHVDLTRVAEGVLVVDQGSTNGVVANGIRIATATVPPGTRIKLGDTELEVRDRDQAPLDFHDSDRLAGLRGSSPKMRRLMGQVERAAQSHVGVLLLGESGTGKELVARALHDLGPRKGRPFSTIDCGALAPTLVASELFGHERGAFTGADRERIGAIEQASGGTLFLDEIGELPATLQPALLGALERKRIRRLGGRADIPVDVRIVSATHRDLRAEVNAGTFRLDLYYRIAVVRLELPPLRDRASDIPILVEHFLREAGHAGSVEEIVSTLAMRALEQHRWPGNVRELRNVVEAALAMGEPPELTASGAAPAADAIGALLDTPYREARASLLGDFEKRYLVRLLERSNNNVSQAARLARMDRSHLIDLLTRHGIRE